MAAPCDLNFDVMRKKILIIKHVGSNSVADMFETATHYENMNLKEVIISFGRKYKSTNKFLSKRYSEEQFDIDVKNKWYHFKKVGKDISFTFEYPHMTAIGFIIQE